MSNKHIEELLQQCIAAFDAGFSPEECLSAYPSARDELEPLLRQAVSLRVAFAAAPRSEFREQAKQRLMFAAGREVSAALAATPSPEFTRRARATFMFQAGHDVSTAYANDPNPDFVQDARQRFIHAAGADAQEGLRNVPPPRLPFWSNARRRLLEAAQQQQAQPAGRRPGTVGVFAMRAGLSAAVVVLAMAVAGLAYMVGFNADRSANAEYAALERDLHELELQAQAGVTISPAAVQDVVDRTNKLAGQLDSQPQLVEKLPALIERQREVVLAAANDGVLAPELQQAQAQLNQTAEKVDELLLAASQAPTATPQTAATNSAAANQTPAVVKTPAASGTPELIESGQVRVTPLLDVTDNQTWKRVETHNLSFTVPSSWQLLGVTLDANGSANLDVSIVILAGPGIVLTADLNSGNIVTLIDGGGPQFVLRTSGINGKAIDIDQAFFDKAGEYSIELKHLLDTLELSGDLVPAPATATPSPSATSPATATPPPVTATP